MHTNKRLVELFMVRFVALVACGSYMLSWYNAQPVIRDLIITTIIFGFIAVGFIQYALQGAINLIEQYQTRPTHK